MYTNSTQVLLELAHVRGVSTDGVLRAETYLNESMERGGDLERGRKGENQRHYEFLTDFRR